MDTIDVHDLPEPLARALAEQADEYRKQLAVKKNGAARQPIIFRESLGDVHGRLTRDEIYADDE
ncbi:MAG: hypothetical protein HY270_05565 [Deltaproteobacteria bacterium]|nr:hypothetical protein [Deltaproteobacteria bacterium]